jgi:lipoprotein-anchoring transpeptidase ErfK/SrfK
VIITLPRQLAFVYRNGVLIGVSTVSSGTKGHATPTGVFTVLQKKVEHYSNLYNAAPMPYMQRLTWDGIAMHAGNLPGYPASHGCVRLPKAFAKLSPQRHKTWNDRRRH